MVRSLDIISDSETSEHSTLKIFSQSSKSTLISNILKLFLSYLFLLRHVTYRLAMKRLVLRYFYIRKLKYYFSPSSDNNFKYLISSEKVENFEIKQQAKFNVIDFLNLIDKYK